MAVYYAVLTTAGQNALAAAQAAGTTLTINSFSVGDSNGIYYEPDQSQTALVHQVWNGPLTRIYTHNTNQNWIVAETLIPASDGGFDIREAGLYAGSTLIAVAKYPLTQKPAVGSGSEKDIYIRMIINITNATNVTQYIDDSVAHYTIDDWNKQPFKLTCRVATTANITLSGTQTIDGVAVVANDRVLVKNQTTASQNGIYVVKAGAWLRAYDFDNALEVAAAIIPVREGTVNGDDIWMLSTDGTITIGTTALTFIPIFHEGTTAGTYKSVTVDAYGRVTAGTNPTTLAGYGITNGQPLDATLTALAALATSANQMIYSTGTDTFAMSALTAFARTLLDDADAATALTTLGAAPQSTTYTKSEVDAITQGLKPKQSVKCATTANITLSGTQTIDGVAVAVDDRVLVKNQTTASQNGIYVVASGSWTRATDADTAVELTSAYCFIEQGTTLADTGWVCTSDNITLGTTSITFVQFSGTGAYQPLDATLSALAALVTSANQMIYSTGADTFAMSALTAFARTLLDDADAATARTTLGLAIGTNVQAYDATLAALAGLATAANQMIYSTGADTFAMSSLTAFARTLLDDADAAAARTTLDTYSKTETVDQAIAMAIALG